MKDESTDMAGFEDPDCRPVFGRFASTLPWSRKSKMVCSQNDAHTRLIGGSLQDYLDDFREAKEPSSTMSRDAASPDNTSSLLNTTLSNRSTDSGG